MTLAYKALGMARASTTSTVRRNNTFVTFDVILVLLVFSGKVTTQLRSGGKFVDNFVCKSFLITPVKE